MGVKILLTLTAATCLTAASVSSAQALVEARIPVRVNVAATVSILPPSASAGTGVSNAALSADTWDTLKIMVDPTHSSISRGGKRHVGASVSARYDRGNVSLTLPARQYRSAALSLYSVNGRRVLRGAWDAPNGAFSVSRPNIAPGVYHLSVKGVDGNAFSARLAHSGGRLYINAAFGDGGSLSDHTPVYATGHSLRKRFAASSGGAWTLTAAAPGYAPATRALSPVAGRNPPVDITLYSQDVIDVITKLPNRPLTREELDAWIARYIALGGPSEFEQEVVRLINDERIKAGAAALGIDTALMMASRFKSQNMVDLNYFSHTSPIYATNAGDYSPGIIARLFGVNTNPSENIAQASGATPSSIVSMWMNSEGHRNNNLNTSSRYIGVGAYSAEPGSSRSRTYVTANFRR